MQIKLKNSVVQDSAPSASDLPEVGELAVNGNINSIGGFMRASDNSIVKIFGPGSVTTPTATTTVSGIAELATSAETTTGSATNRVVTPAGLNAVTVAERSTSNTNYVAKAGSTLTGVLTMPNGSNSAPAINFGDSDSGIFGGTNTVSLAAGGTTRLTADTGVTITGALSVSSNIATSGGQITCGVTGTSGIQIINDGTFGTLHSADLVLRTHSTERARLDTSGRLLVGLTSSRAIANLTTLQQIEGTDAASGLSITRNSANNVGGSLNFGKTRGAALGATTIVQDGDMLGQIRFSGADGNDLTNHAASIVSHIDGTPGNNDTPGRLEFKTTADGNSDPTTRLTIDSAGLATFAGNITSTKASADNILKIETTTSGDAKLSFNAAGAGGHDIEYIRSNNTLNFKQGGGSVRMSIAANGTVDVAGNLDVGAGIDVTGAITGTGDLTIDTNTLHVDSSNNRVGIGTTSPDSKLRIVDGSDNDAIIYVSGADTTSEYVSLGVQTGKAIVRGGGAGSTNTALAFEYSNAGTETEGMRIDSSGRVLIGTTGTKTIATVGTALQVAGTSFATSGFTQQRFANDMSGPSLLLGKSRGSIGNYTIVNNGDELGKIRFYGADGNDFDNYGAEIVAAVDGTPGSNDMPGRLVFKTTADGNATPTERLRIDSSGKVGIGETSMDALLVIKGNSDASTTPSIRLKDGSDTREAWITNTAGDLLLATGGDDNTPHSKLTLMDGNIIHFSTANTERMRIDSSGNVGIGTTSPLKRLHIADAGDVALVLQTTNAVDDKEIFEIGCTGNASNHADLVFRTRVNAGTGGSEVMRLTNDEKVGIGTASPTSLLTLNHATSPFIRLNDSDVTKVGIGADGGLSYVFAQDGNPLVFTTSDGTAFTERMRIDTNGNVMIGATSASGKLHVEHSGELNSYFVGNTSTSGSRIILWNKNTTANSFTGVLGADAGGQTTASINFYSADNATNEGYLTLETRPANGVPTEAMRIDSSGNVGIGSTSPTFGAGSGLEVQRAGVATVRCDDTAHSTAIEMKAANGASALAVPTNHPLLLETNGTERMRILAGGGLTFNGDTAAANALNDYEEGTFQATVSQGFNNVQYETNGRNGSYTKIGRFVFFTLLIHMGGTTATTTNDIQITGLPFTAKSFSHDNNAAGGADPFYQDAFYNANDFSALVTDGQSKLQLVRRSDGTGLKGTDVNAGREFRMTGTYMT